MQGSTFKLIVIGPPDARIRESAVALPITGFVFFAPRGKLKVGKSGWAKERLYVNGFGVYSLRSGSTHAPSQRTRPQIVIIAPSTKIQDLDTTSSCCFTHVGDF